MIKFKLQFKTIYSKFVSQRDGVNSSGAVSSADWVLDPRELESMFTDKTKAIVLNTPHNPVGKVFSRSELDHIANLCKKHNVLVIADEVYEWMVYAPNKHIRIGNFIYIKKIKLSSL